MDTPDPCYEFQFALSQKGATLELVEAHSGAALDLRKFPLTTPLSALELAAIEMWHNYAPDNLARPVPRIIAVPYIGF